MQTTHSVPVWASRTNVYEVNVRQYTEEGTLTAFAKELPRLRDMGVETLWFMPLTPIAQKNKKGSMGSYYAAYDYTSISPEFGTMEDFKALVSTAQAQGFKVIIDWVANHTGWDHVWTITHPDYFKHEGNGDFHKASGMDDIIELEYGNPELRRAMIEAMKFWITETGIDGFRCDLASWVELPFWKEAKAVLQELKPLFWLGEFDPLENPDYMQVFDAAYTWTWMHKAEAFYKQQLPLSTLNNVLQQYSTAPGIAAWFTANHDENTWNGTEYEKYGDAAKALAVFSVTWSGIPLIYSGQEMPNYKRLQFFEKDPIEWIGTYELHDFYKTLLQIRASGAALEATAPVQKIMTTDDAHVLAFVRKSGHEEVLVVLNLSREDVTISLHGNEIMGHYKNVFDGSIHTISSATALSLKPWDYLVFQK